MRIIEGMEFKEQVFFVIVLLSFTWVIVVLIFKFGRRRIRQVITINKKYKENIFHDDVMAPKEFVVNLVVNKDDDIDFGVFADMAIRWKDLKAGKYKVPSESRGFFVAEENTEEEETEDSQEEEEKPEEKEELSKGNIDFQELLDPFPQPNN